MRGFVVAGVLISELCRWALAVVPLGAGSGAAAPRQAQAVTGRAACGPRRGAAAPAGRRRQGCWAGPTAPCAPWRHAARSQPASQPASHRHGLPTCMVCDVGIAPGAGDDDVGGDAAQLSRHRLVQQPLGALGRRFLLVLALRQGGGDSSCGSRVSARDFFLPCTFFLYLPCGRAGRGSNPGVWG